MKFKIIKTTTGVMGLIGVILAVFCYFFSLIYSGGRDTDVEMLGVAIVFIAFGIPLGVVALVEFIISIIYLVGKFKTRTFYVIGAILSILDAVILFALVYFAFLVTEEVGGIVIPIVTLICSLPVTANMVLKIVCAVKFQKTEN
ncbi:MAG: hypothetical protein ACI4VK_00185 [Candidatus Coproplasma sp.]